MVITQVTPNSWFETARAAATEPAKQKFLKDLGAALASNNPEVFAPPLRQIMRIAQVVGSDRVVDVLAAALQRSNTPIKDERLAEALLDLAAQGGRKALDVIKSISEPESGYVIACRWNQTFLDRGGYKLDYAVGKDLRDLNARIKILVGVGYTDNSILGGAEERIQEIRGAIVGDDAQLENASARLCWFFIHGSERDRAALQTAFSEYTNHSGPAKGEYRKRVVSIRRGAALLLNLERQYAKDSKDSDSHRALSGAVKLMEAFFGGADSVPKSIPTPVHQLSPLDHFRQELSKVDFSVERLRKLAKQVGSGVMDVVRPALLTADNPAHRGAVEYLRSNPSQAVVELLGEVAGWSLPAATALAAIASGGATDNRVRGLAADAFWVANNVEPIFLGPEKYVGLVVPQKGAVKGVFRDVDHARSFMRDVAFKRENVPQVVALMPYVLRLMPRFETTTGITKIRPFPEFKRQIQEFFDYITDLSVERLRKIVLKVKTDAVFYEALIANSGSLSAEKKFAIADLIVDALPTIPEADRWLGAIMSHLPFDSHPKYYEPFIRLQMWEPLAAACFDWAYGLHITERVDHNVEPVIAQMTDDQIEKVLLSLPRVGQRLSKKADSVWHAAAVAEGMEITKRMVAEVRARGSTSA